MFQSRATERSDEVASYTKSRMLEADSQFGDWRFSGYGGHADKAPHRLGCQSYASTQREMDVYQPLHFSSKGTEERGDKGHA